MLQMITVKKMFINILNTEGRIIKSSSFKIHDSSDGNIFNISRNGYIFDSTTFVNNKKTTGFIADKLVNNQLLGLFFLIFLLNILATNRIVKHMINIQNAIENVIIISFSCFKWHSLFLSMKITYLKVNVDTI
jgi:hypothetical protein